MNELSYNAIKLAQMIALEQWESQRRPGENDEYINQKIARNVTFSTLDNTDSESIWPIWNQFSGNNKRGFVERLLEEDSPEATELILWVREVLERERNMTIQLMAAVTEMQALANGQDQRG